MNGFAQIQAEIDKMMKQAQDIIKQIGKDSTVNKPMKDAQANQKQIRDAIKDLKRNNNPSSGLYSSDPGDYSNVDNWIFPAKILLHRMTR